MITVPLGYHDNIPNCTPPSYMGMWGRKTNTLITNSACYRLVCMYVSGYNDDVPNSILLHEAGKWCDSIPPSRLHGYILNQHDAHIHSKRETVQRYLVTMATPQRAYFAVCSVYGHRLTSPWLLYRSGG